MQDKIKQILDKNDFSNCCVLLVEDDEIMRVSLEDRLRLENIPVRAVSDLSGAIKELEKGTIDLVITDIRLPDGTGTELFANISNRFHGIPVILMTAFGDISDAVALVKAGALDYLTKPFDINDFISRVARHMSRINDAHLALNSFGNNNDFKAGAGRLGKSAPMRKIERLIANLSKSNASVLITGESGVGKEVVATLIHNNSTRKQGPMVRVNCAALSPTLVESELFGHEKGAFTGAIKQRIGRFEQAQGGTIFLDEIAEVSPDVQVKLLRVLQEREIERVGGIEPINLDVRIIAATQIDLEEAIKSHRFRSDLYWRLNVIHVNIPPLRERWEDIIYFARLFVAEQAASTGNPVKGISKEAEIQLQSMSFPGNVRELKNIIERAVALCVGPWISCGELMIEDHDVDDISRTTLRQSIEDAEQKAIHRALLESDNKISRAADALGISRKNLWEKMKRHNIDTSK
jgi:DNA-binding NtrC family response regulator